jgi:lactoylglutathione lyase
MLGIPIQGLFETHLTVADLDVSVPFYRDSLGLELAHFPNERRVAFFWLGEERTSMLGIWEVGTSPNSMRLHLAFASTVDAVLAAPGTLRAAGAVPRGFHGEPVEEPVVIAWIPALSLYFTDPDGHLLEYLAVLHDPPRPELGVVPFSQWKQAMR